MVGAQAIIGDVVSPRQRGRYMGYFGAVFGLSSVIGPLARRVLHPAPQLAMGLLHQHADRHRRARSSSRWSSTSRVKRTEHAIDYLGHCAARRRRSPPSSCSPPGAGPPTPGARRRSSPRPWPRSCSSSRSAWSRRAAEPIIPLGLFRIRCSAWRARSASSSASSCSAPSSTSRSTSRPCTGPRRRARGCSCCRWWAGCSITFIMSGRLVTRWGRYKIFPIIGTGVMAVGLFLLSLLTPTTSSGRLVDLHVRGRPRHRLRHAGPRGRRPERRALQPAGNGHLVRGLLPLDRRRVRRRPVRRHLQQPPRRRAAEVPAGVRAAAPFTAATSRPTPLSSMRFRRPSTTATCRPSATPSMPSS